MIDEEAGDRPPLRDLGAERCVLGGMLETDYAIADATAIVNEGDFYEPRHATIFATIVGLYSAGKPTDVFAVVDALTTSGELGRIGGPTYLTDCKALIPTAANTGYYARIVADRAALRRIQLVGVTIAQLPHQPGIDAQAAIECASALLDDATAERATNDLRHLGDLVEPALKAIEEAAAHTGLRGQPTGLVDLDHLTGGLRPGQLILIAARPAMGKSILAVDISRAIAIHHNQPAVLFSLEMSHQELMTRLLAAECSIPLDLIINGNLADHDWSRLAQKAGELETAPLYIDDSPGPTVVDIRAKARRLAARTPLALIVIDYLQLMRVVKDRDHREREVAEISRSLKLLAKELEVPVVAVAQLNRGPEARTNKRPHLSDLRESGSLEADADLVLLLHRPDYYDRESPRSGEVDIDVAKNRNGPTDTITAAAQLRFARFADLAYYKPGGDR